MRYGLIALALLLGAPAANATNYYVSDTGSDERDCLAPATACATMQRPVNLAPPGNHNIHLLCGKPIGEECQFSSSDPKAAAVNVTHHRFFGIWGDCKDDYILTKQKPDIAVPSQARP